MVNMLIFVLSILVLKGCSETAQPVNDAECDFEAGDVFFEEADCEEYFLAGVGLQRVCMLILRIGTRMKLGGSQSFLKYNTLRIPSSGNTQPPNRLTNEASDLALLVGEEYELVHQAWYFEAAIPRIRPSSLLKIATFIVWLAYLSISYWLWSTCTRILMEIGARLFGECLGGSEEGIEVANGMQIMTVARPHNDTTKLHDTNFYNDRKELVAVRGKIHVLLYK